MEDRLISSKFSTRFLKFEYSSWFYVLEDRSFRASKLSKLLEAEGNKILPFRKRSNHLNPQCPSTWCSFILGWGSISDLGTMHSPVRIRWTSACKFGLHGVTGKVSFSKDATTKWWYIYGFRDRAETRGGSWEPLFSGAPTPDERRKRRSQGGRGGIRFYDAADSSLTQSVSCSYTRENSRKDHTRVRVATSFSRFRHIFRRLRREGLKRRNAGKDATRSAIFRSSAMRARSIQCCPVIFRVYLEHKVDVAPRLRNVCASATVKTILLQGPREEPAGSFEISLCYSQTVFSLECFPLPYPILFTDSVGLYNINFIVCVFAFSRGRCSRLFHRSHRSDS